ncbi:hypothetical protein E2C01_020971 [Portunus trituberculatus]|uniref:Uncharacterized protein n=1 Tax=Portunus trituberculatus TaxID=210409 RepID=A0A5B7E208_PORTR|nr:hypothetical protein [Portunus trituberculatus]
MRHDADLQDCIVLAPDKVTLISEHKLGCVDESLIPHLTREAPRSCPQDAHTPYPRREVVRSFPVWARQPATLLQPPPVRSDNNSSVNSFYEQPRPTPIAVATSGATHITYTVLRVFPHSDILINYILQTGKVTVADQRI